MKIFLLRIKNYKRELINISNFNNVYNFFIFKRANLKFNVKFKYIS